MTALLAALVAPALGPILYVVFHGRERFVRAVDAFVYVAVPLLVLGQVLPYAWEEASWVPVLVLAAGALLPEALERVVARLEERTDDLATVVGLSGLVLHALLEGAALVPVRHQPEQPLVAAIVLHRIPVGLVVWWLLRPRHGRGIAATGVAALCFATLGGYALGSGLEPSAHGAGVELYQAFVSGSLMHVVFHQGRHHHTAEGHHQEPLA